MKKLIAIAALAALALTGTAQAEETFPDRPIMLMVSYGPGGATDFQARIVTMTSGNEEALGMPIAILNKPGAGGRVGWNWLATQAEADGYTMGVYNIPHFIAQSIEGGVEYDVDSFEPIANWGADPAVLVVGADSEFNSLQDVIDFAKANPGKLTTSGAGLYVGHHIAALQMEKAGDFKLAYIPTQGGGAAAMKAVIAGDVMAGINNLSDAFRAREAGNVKILAVADLAGWADHDGKRARGGRRVGELPRHHGAEGHPAGCHRQACGDDARDVRGWQRAVEDGSGRIAHAHHDARRGSGDVAKTAGDADGVAGRSLKGAPPPGSRFGRGRQGRKKYR